MCILIVPALVLHVQRNSSCVSHQKANFLLTLLVLRWKQWKTFKRNFESNPAHTPTAKRRQTRHTCTSAHAVCYSLCTIVCNYNVGITSPGVDSVFILLEHSQIKWEMHFFPHFIFLNRKIEGKLGPYHSLQTQQWAIIRFVSTFCSWCLIRVTSSTL